MTRAYIVAILAVLFLVGSCHAGFAHDQLMKLEVGCHDLEQEPDREPDTLVYDSFRGLVFTTWVLEN